MKTIKLISIVLALFLCNTAISSGENKTKKKACKEHPILSGPCFKVHGRMSLYNGTPSIRIWPTGTKRILGVSEGEYYNEEYKYLPDKLEDKLNWENAIFADFTVCPFTEDKPGVMRLVCVESAENIKIQKH